MHLFPRFPARFETVRTSASWILAAIVSMVLAPHSLPGQSGLIATKPLSHTPMQVTDGRAALMQHYDSSKPLRITIGLTPPHMEAERKLIDQLHDKKSPEFHKWLSPEEWDSRFAPSVEDEQAVVDWAKSQGLTVSNRFADRLLVDIVAPAGAIEKAFNVRINNYSMDGDTYFANDRDPELPSSLTGTVQSVMGLNSFLRLRPGVAGGRKIGPRPDFVPGPAIATAEETHANGSQDKLTIAMKKSKAHTEAVSGAHTTNGNYDPVDIYNSQAYDTQALYNQGHCCNPYHGAGSPPETTIALAAFGDLAYSDVNSFQSQFSYLAENIQKVYIDGNYTCTNSPNLTYDLNCLEVTLDTEWAMAMSNSFGSYTDTSKVWIYEGASYSNIADVYNFMVSDGYAKVTSTSWSCTEFACFDGPTMDSLDGIFSKMVGQGWTLIGDAGDKGATDNCSTTTVGFPISDPNFIAAGGTTLNLSLSTSGPTYQSEVGWTGNTSTGSCSTNNGGGGGGFSQHFAAPSYQSSFGYANRSLPDVALNANRGQNMYFQGNGGLFGVGGTSIVAPELAGFFAQQNAYGLAIGNVCGGGSNACAPIGNANYYMYAAGSRTGPHDPFYDITSGCNSNDITAANRQNYYCAATGFDQVTGWGSFNMLQMAWVINWYDAQANGGPTVAFSGPLTNYWYNTDQTVSWTINDNVGDRGGSPTGIAGFTQGWDYIPSDVYGESTPGAGNSFYSGPQFPNGTGGCLQTGTDNGCSGNTSQGCHTAFVQGWNNMGVASGIQAYGPVCWDNVAPSTTISLSGAQSNGIYTGPVTMRITASDATSGVRAIYYTNESGVLTQYTGPLTFNTGYHYVSAYSVDYAGNKSFVQAALFSVKAATATRIAASVNPLTYGNSVTLTASVTPSFDAAPLGTVTFKDGSITLGTASLSGGKASLSVSTGLVGGSNSITASYAGNNNDFPSSSSSLTETVNKAKTSATVSSSSSTSHYDSAVIFTATVKSATTGTPTGSVTFKNGASTLAAVSLNGGKASYTTGALPLGSHSITAIYGGNGDFLTATSPAITQTVQQEPTTTSISSSANPSTYQEKISLTVTVHAGSGTPAGTVTLKNGSTAVGTATLNAGKATFSQTSTTVGTVHYTAVYGGNTDFSVSTSAVLNQTENKASTSTSISSPLNPSTFGKTVTFTAAVKASVSGTPSGTVTFKNGSTVLGTATLASGKATYSTTTLTGGSHAITADYNGNTDFNTSSSPALTETVDKVSTTTTLASSLNPSTFGHSVTLTAKVASAVGAPTGTVTFENGGTALGTVTLSAGKATITTTSLPVGNHYITVKYNGSTNDNTSASSSVLEVVKQASTTTTLISSVNPSKKGTAVKFTASVTATEEVPTGTVNFMDGSTKLGSATLSSGKAAFSTSGLTAATHSITAVYVGATDFVTSKSAALSQKVNQ